MKWLSILVFACLCTVASAQSETAAQLYNKGIQLLEAGKGDQGRKALQQVIADFPGTTYAKLAKESVEKPIISSIEYKDVSPLSEREIRKRLELANADLMVGKVFKTEGIDQARQLIAQMIMKKKAKAKDVVITPHDEPDHKVAILVTVVR